jgi:MYXO-CTERM domain-containing protein
MHSRAAAWIVGVVVCASTIGGTPVAAHAYTVKNIFSRGCHEEITSAALRAVRGAMAAAPPIAPSSDEQALIDDLQFTPDSDMRDLGGATLLVAVRDNDLKGRGSEDVTQLAAVHGNPDGQQEHCLRSQDQDEPNGTEAAVAACRAFVRGRIAEALTGLDAASNPDPTRRTSLGVHLSLRGYVDAPLPTYYVKMGQAIHAIEDGFTHTYRTADEKQITVVLNWIDKANGALVESRDGPAHASELDRCDDPDPLRATRHALAVQAATGVLRATLDGQMTPDQKMAAVDALLDEYLGYSPGCTFGNGWCDAPERKYADASCGCHSGRSGGGAGATFAGAIAMVVLAVARRRRRKRGAARATSVLVIAGTILIAPGAARADSTTTTARPALPATPTPKTAAAPVTTTTTTTTVPAETPAVAPTVETTVRTPSVTMITVKTPTVADPHAPPAPTIIAVTEPGPRDATKTAWGASLSGSGSVDNPALAGALGLRLHLSKQWSFGLDAEWNPWLALNGVTFHRGAVDVFGSAMLRFPLAYENFNLRTRVSAGASYLITNLYGAPSGSVGPYFGVSFLAIEWKLSRTFWLVIDPLNIAVPVPQIKSVPLAYPQYRFSLALEVYLG